MKQIFFNQQEKSITTQFEIKNCRTRIGGTRFSTVNDTSIRYDKKLIGLTYTCLSLSHILNNNNVIFWEKQAIYRSSLWCNFGCNANLVLHVKCITIKCNYSHNNHIPLLRSNLSSCRIYYLLRRFFYYLLYTDFFCSFPENTHHNIMKMFIYKFLGKI